MGKQTNRKPEEAETILSQEIFRELKDGIISNTIPMGTPLIIRDLAARWGVSTTPVRDAVLMLEAEGWAKPSGRNRIVSIPGTRELLELSEIRLDLELLAFRKVKHLIDAAMVSRLHDIVEEAKIYDRKRDGVNYMITSTRYHHFLSTQGDNRVLSASLEQILQKLNRQSLSRFEKSQLSRDFTLKEHEQLVYLLSQERWDDYVLLLTKHIQFWPDFSEVSSDKATHT